jgi:restriction endonuclease S subunit
MSEVSRNNDLRIESEFYNAKKVNFKSVKGNVIETFSQYGTSKGLNEDGYGYPVLRLNEFDSFFIHTPAKYCNLIDSETYESLKLKKNDVLICRTNGNPKYVGKASLVPRDYDYAFASYIYRIRPDEKYIDPSTLVAYLNSTYGRSEIERLAMVGNQANFSPAKFRQIEIPVFGKDFRKRLLQL